MRPSIKIGRHLGRETNTLLRWRRFRFQYRSLHEGTSNPEQIVHRLHQIVRMVSVHLLLQENLCLSAAMPLEKSWPAAGIAAPTQEERRMMNKVNLIVIV